MKGNGSLIRIAGAGGKWLSLILVLFTLAWVPLTGNGQAAGEVWLAVATYTDWRQLSAVETLATLEGTSTAPQAVVRGTAAELKGLGLPLVFLDTVQAGDRYLLMRGLPLSLTVNPPGGGKILWQGGELALARLDAPAGLKALEEWSMFAAEMRLLPQEAMVWEDPLAVGLESTTVSYDPLIAGMVNQVSWSDISTLTAQLSGETPATVDGAPYTIRTRYTTSGVPIKKATRFAYEQFQALGLNASYHYWSDENPELRNVVGEKSGQTQPDEIILVTAHLDDMPPGSTAPGADDNASGSAGVMLAANILNRYTFQRTLRFVLFTGEEQGLLGSEAYARYAKNQNEKIKAVYNLDMIGWDNSGAPVARLHTRASSAPGYASDLELVNLFLEVVEVYGLDSGFAPRLDADGLTFSDHSSFWNRGYPAILAIEDDANDFNAYYHTVNDRLSRLNAAYFTRFVQATVGSAAHAAKFISPSLDNSIYLPVLQR